ncbi:hypothetical protein Droror1_Dr00022627 [Drosera rotundifolia]
MELVEDNLPIRRICMFNYLGSLARENKMPKEELRRTKKKNTEAKNQSVEDNFKDSVLPTDISANSTGKETSAEELNRGSSRYMLILTSLFCNLWNYVLNFHGY